MVVVNGVRGEKMQIELCKTEEEFQRITVLQLKEKIKEQRPDLAGKDTERTTLTS